MILHIDMDAFFASVEEREQPQLKGRPLVVGGAAEARGVVAAANYAAREYGVRSAMPMRTALQKCPHLTVLPSRGALYVAASKDIREIFHRFTPVVETLSLDEAFLDPSGSEKLHGDAAAIGKKIKQAIQDELQLTASVGVAPNKFLAKLASDDDKPDGFRIINPGEVDDFLLNLPLAAIWGAGAATRAKLNALGIHDVRGLRAASEDFLLQHFGQHGKKLRQLAHGIDARQVTPDRAVKSISQEVTFAEDLRDLSAVHSVALSLTESVGFRLRAAKLRARTLGVKLRFHDFETITRARTLDAPTDATAHLWRAVKSLLEQNLAEKRFALRLVGVAASHLSDAQSGQADLLQSEDKNRAIDSLADQINARYGKHGIKRGGALQKPRG